MAKMTPLQTVVENFGSKKALAEKLSAVLERPEGVSQKDFERRVATMSNSKLLRLHRVHETLNRRFGSKAALVDKIMALHSVGKEDKVYRKKIETYSIARLLDMHKALKKRVYKAKKSAASLDVALF